LKTDPKGSRRLVQAVCRALLEKKADDLKVLDVSDHSSITDYLVVATVTSEPHLRALRIELDRVMKETGTRVVGRDAAEESGWTVVDAFDVMVHLFTAEKRALFGLEQLWADAEEVSVAKLLAPARKPAPRKPRRKSQKP
jgi:ribosome-associated protein